MKSLLNYNFLRHFWFFIVVIISHKSLSQCIDSSKIDTAAFTYHCNPTLSDLVDPFCGCDGNTYVNYDCAYFHGVIDGTFGGGCKCIDSSVIDFNYDSTNNPFELPMIVCGCNGKSYRDPYEAYYKFGVAKFEVGNGCDCYDPTFININTYLKYSPVFRDDIFGCFYDNFTPVCGCNNVTYRSSLEAIYKHGITKFSDGKCPCVDSSIIDKQFDCDSIFDPVCGCDSVTYKNSCVAEKHHGILEYKKGPCQCYDSLLYTPNLLCARDDGTGKTGYVCGCDSITYVNYCIATCLNNIIKILHYGVCRCPDYQIIKPGVICSEKYKPVCGCDGKTYRNICEAEQKNGVWANNRSKACYCKDNNIADPTKNCYPNIIYDPVCGCDSITYPNECSALYTYGITSWRKGVCNYNCVDKSIIDTFRYCSDIYEPVCGCDGKTYKNECIGYFREGITKFKAGPCDSVLNNSDYKLTDLYLFPNPVISSMIIKSPNNIINTYFIKNTNGIVLLNGIVNDYEIILNVELFPSGYYLIELVMQTKRVVKGFIKI